MKQCIENGFRGACVTTIVMIAIAKEKFSITEDIFAKSRIVVVGHDDRCNGILI